MRDHSGKFPVKKMAEVLGVSRSRYYSYLKNPMNRYKMDYEDLNVIIQEIYEANRRLYGSPRIFRELRKRNIRCSRRRVARIMRENGFKGSYCQKFFIAFLICCYYY
ncbi:MAG: IS3 family transposase [Spirochaetota bacterium]|nr:IS3 family transposase [Spirochaetota bacterium]